MLGWRVIDKELKRRAHAKGYEIGTKVFYPETGKASIIKELLTCTFAEKDKQECSLAYLSHVYQDYIPIDKLTIISDALYESYSYQREIEQLKNQMAQCVKDLRLYIRAYERLKTGTASSEVCYYGPCKKSELGICDGECDYPGA